VRLGFFTNLARTNSRTSIFAVIIICCSLVLSGCSVKTLDRRLVEPDKARQLDPVSESKSAGGQGKLPHINQEVPAADIFLISPDYCRESSNLHAIARAVLYLPAGSLE